MSDPYKGAEDEYAGTDNEVLSSAVLGALQPRLPRITDLDARNGMTTDAALDRAEATVKQIRAWMTTITSRKLRAEYEGWLRDYYERGYREAREELRTHKGRDENAKRWAKVTERLDRARNLEIPKP